MTDDAAIVVVSWANILKEKYAVGMTRSNINGAKQANGAHLLNRELHRGVYCCIPPS